MGHTAIVVGAGIAGLASAISPEPGGSDRAGALAGARGGRGGFHDVPQCGAAFRGLRFDDAAVAGLGYPTRAGGTWDLHGRPVLAPPCGVRRTDRGPSPAHLPEPVRRGKPGLAGLRVMLGTRVDASSTEQTRWRRRRADG